MNKKEKTKKVLFVYPSMIMGGSTTSLLSCLNCLDQDAYHIDLQLMRNEGPLFELIPEHVNILPAAELYTGITGKIIKLFLLVFKGYFMKALWFGIRDGKDLLSREVLADFQANELCAKSKTQYNCAIGFLEGWSNRYLACSVMANKKYAWIHSTFGKTTARPKREISWIKKVDKVVFVTDACREDFENILPEMANKAITIENISDSSIIRKRSQFIDDTDKAYQKFSASNLFKIITVCRLTIQVKGLDRIVSCAKALKEDGEKFIWYIIGDGDDEKKLHNMIVNANIEDCVFLVGKKMNPYPFIAIADIMCMLSRYEGKPMAITESMILGVPPVVTAYLSAHEQIKHGYDGIVIENSAASAIDALRACIRNKEKIYELKNNLKNSEYGNKNYIKIFEEKLLDS